MQFNVSKCTWGRQTHGPSTPCREPDLRPRSLRDIGVKIHQSLRPSTQCREAAGRANVFLGQITMAFNFRDRNTFVMLYKQYVRPHLEFSVPAWSPWTQGDKETVERIQKRAVRMISGLQGKSYEDRLLELNMPSLEGRRLLYDMVQTFKIVRGYDDVNLRSLRTWFSLVGNNHTRITRQRSDPLTIVRPIVRNEIIF